VDDAGVHILSLLLCPVFSVAYVCVVLCLHAHIANWMCVLEPMQHSNPIELFQWLPKEHMCILVYLVRLDS